MRSEKVFNAIGLLMLAGCFAFAFTKVFERGRAGRDEGVHVIRFAHWQLESGLRTAFDALARDYEKLNPGVRVEQLAIPERVYTQWLQTQLIGGNATELVQLGKMPPNAEDEMLARFFVPLTELVERPNPYNAGTELEGVAWRETFVDGLVGGFNYRANLLEYYGVPMSLHTIRFYYNVSLWKKIFGDASVPSTYEEFIAVCDKADAYAKANDLPLIPIAGSKLNGPLVITRFASSQTQRLVSDGSFSRDFARDSVTLGLAYLRGRWTLDTPQVSDGLAITREIGLRLQPGYMQASREDATFHFVQGRALFIATGSYDAPSFRSEADFEIGVFNPPVPSAEHARFGRNVLGAASEAATNTSLSFGIPRQARDRERALDFLHYLTSRMGNARFTELSDWLPAVSGTPIASRIATFVPRESGYVDGFELTSLGSETRHLVHDGWHHLVHPSGSVEDFKAGIAGRFETAVRRDIARQANTVMLNVGRQDVAIAAADALHDERRDAMLEAQNQQESLRAWILGELSRTADD